MTWRGQDPSQSQSDSESLSTTSEPAAPPCLLWMAILCPAILRALMTMPWVKKTTDWDKGPVRPAGAETMLLALLISSQDAGGWRKGQQPQIPGVQAAEVNELSPLSPQRPTKLSSPSRPLARKKQKLCISIAVCSQGSLCMKPVCGAGACGADRKRQVREAPAHL